MLRLFSKFFNSLMGNEISDVHSYNLTDLPIEIIYKILNQLNDYDLHCLGPVNHNFVACRISVLKNRGYSALPSKYSESDIQVLKISVKLQRMVTKLNRKKTTPISKWIFSNQVKLSEQDAIGKLILQALNKSVFPELDLSDIKVQGGLLNIPARKLTEIGHTTAIGRDKYHRPFFVMHVRQKEEINNISVITMHQRYDRTKTDKLWVISQGASLIQPDPNDPCLKGNDIKKIALILMGTHPKYELFPENLLIKIT